MTISPPSDIVLDVARAADPARHRMAVARLDGAAAGEAFEGVLETVQAEPAPPRPGLAPPPAAPYPRPADADQAYRGFEAMALTVFLQAMIPDSPSIFGDGTAGSIWKSMLAERLADQMAKSGGIGIAAQLARSSKDETMAASMAGNRSILLVEGPVVAAGIPPTEPQPSADS